MAQQPSILKDHRSSIYLLAACIAALGLMFLMTVSKDLQSRRALEARLAEADRQAGSRELLAPLLAQLKDESKAPLPEVTGEGDVVLPDSDMSADDYQAVIGKIVRQCGLEQTSLSMNLQSILSDTGSIRVDLTARGAFPDFRRLILALVRLPFLSDIEEFRVEADTDTELPEMFLQLRLQLETPVESAHEHQ